LLNELLSEGLVQESNYGDCSRAERELEARIPGLPKKFYSDVIGWMGYKNH
jgi:hypothetical protein